MRKLGCSVPSGSQTFQTPTDKWLDLDSFTVGPFRKKHFLLCLGFRGASLEGQGPLILTDALVLLLSPLGSQGQVGSRACALWLPFWPVIELLAFQVAVSISCVL